MFSIKFFFFFFFYLVLRIYRQTTSEHSTLASFPRNHRYLQARSFSPHLLIYHITLYNYHIVHIDYEQMKELEKRQKYPQCCYFIYSNKHLPIFSYIVQSRKLCKNHFNCRLQSSGTEPATLTTHFWHDFDNDTYAQSRKKERGKKGFDDRICVMCTKKRYTGLRLYTVLY